MSSALYVGNLPLGVKGSELQTFCHGIGTPTVVSVRIQKPQKNKSGSATSCYGFVHFRDHDAATTAYALLGNKIMKEHELNVNWSHDKGGGEKQYVVDGLILWFGSQLKVQSLLRQFCRLSSHFSGTRISGSARIPAAGR